MRIINRHSGIDVRCRYRQRSLQFLERFCRRESRQILLHPLVRRQPKPGRRPAPEIRERRYPADSLHLVERATGTVRGPNQRAHAGPGDHVNRYICCSQYAQHPNVRDSPGKSACQRQSHARPRLWPSFIGIGKRAKPFFGVPQPAHGLGHTPLRYFPYFRGITRGAGLV